MTDTIVVYTTPTCPDCRNLKSWLTRLGIAFEERDLSNPAIMDEAKARTGVRVAPITIVRDQVFYGTFQYQKAALSTILGLNEG